jgi:hypothetical protein
VAERSVLLGVAPRRRLVSDPVAADLESAKLEWDRAYRDLVEAAQDPAESEPIRTQLETISAELRRRVGGTYTMRELADEYVVADGWARDVLADQNVPGWPRLLSLVEGAAFHLYARGAVDYTP